MLELVGVPWMFQLTKICRFGTSNRGNMGNYFVWQVGPPGSEVTYTVLRCTDKCIIMSYQSWLLIVCSHGVSMSTRPQYYDWCTNALLSIHDSLISSSRFTVTWCTQLSVVMFIYISSVDYCSFLWLLNFASRCFLCH